MFYPLILDIETCHLTDKYDVLNFFIDRALAYQRRISSRNEQLRTALSAHNVGDSPLDTDISFKMEKIADGASKAKPRPAHDIPEKETPQKASTSPFKKSMKKMFTLDLFKKATRKNADVKENTPKVSSTALRQDTYGHAYGDGDAGIANKTPDLCRTDGHPKGQRKQKRHCLFSCFRG